MLVIIIQYLIWKIKNIILPFASNYCMSDSWLVSSGCAEYFWKLYLRYWDIYHWIIDFCQARGEIVRNYHTSVVTTLCFWCQTYTDQTRHVTTLVTPAFLKLTNKILIVSLSVFRCLVPMSQSYGIV